MGDEQKLTPDEQIALAREQFENATDFTVAVEEEFALVDPASLDLTNRFEEVQAAAALVTELRRRAPDVAIAVSTVTPTGAQRARALFKDTVQHCYLPYDLPGSVRRFLDRLQPQVAVILETEIWPTLYAGLRRRRICIG